MDNYGYPYYNGNATNLYQSHPWVLAVRADGSAFGVLADTTRRCVIDTTTDIKFSANASFPVIIIDRPTPQDVVRELAKLTGTMPLPPKWALGFQQSHFSYTPEMKVIDVAARARYAGIPLDAIWMDIDYMDHYRVFTFSPDRFADAPVVNSDLNTLGIHGIWMIDPAVKIEKGPGINKTFDSGQKNDVWTKLINGSPYEGAQWPSNDPDVAMRSNSLFPDFTKPGVRAWWASMFPDFVKTGVSGVWNDMNEPAVFTGNDNHSMPLTNMHGGDPTLIDDTGTAQGAERAYGSEARYHNVYGMLMAEATREGFAAAQPTKRPFVLSRANYIGGQRFAAAWTGDNTANWPHLKASIPMILNLGLSGQPFAGADIGGYRYPKDDVPNPSKDADAHLFARWMGFGSLYPFSRAHYEKGFGPKNTPAPGWEREPWVYQSDLVEENKRAIERRYRLLPYFYTIFQESSATGLPVWRPIFFADPKDAALRGVDSEFLIGNDILVAVQVDPNVKAPVTLPRGSWYHFAFNIGDVDEAGLDSKFPDLPDLYLRGGAIVPVGPIMEHTDQHPLDPLTLLIGLDNKQQAVGSLYEDSGDGFSYRTGNFRLTTYHAKLDGDHLTLSRDRVQGAMPGSPRKLNLRVLVGGKEFRASGQDGDTITVALAARP